MLEKIVKNNPAVFQHKKIISTFARFYMYVIIYVMLFISIFYPWIASSESGYVLVGAGENSDFISTGYFCYEVTERYVKSWRETKNRSSRVQS